MKAEEISLECLWIIGEGKISPTTKNLAERLGIEPEQLEHAFKRKPYWFVRPLESEEWSLLPTGKTAWKMLESNIKEVRGVIDANFPKDVWDKTEICLSVIATLLLKNLSNPVGLNLVGMPSSNKTTVLSFLYGIDV